MIYSQGKIDPRNPRELLVHLDVTDESRWRLGITDKRKPLCCNGSYHITLTDNKKSVTCPDCLAKLS
jgi:hypothetical protein